MTELRRCPFCGGEAKIGMIFGHKSVYCTKCDACILPSTYADKDELKKSIEAWNRRVSCDTCSLYSRDDGCMASLVEDEVAE